MYVYLSLLIYLILLDVYDTDFFHFIPFVDLLASYNRLKSQHRR